MTEKTDLAKLEKEAEVLHYRILNTQFPLDKRPLQEERAKILEQISRIKLKLETEKEAQTLKLIDDLFNENRKYLAFNINERRIELPEDFITNLTFSCGHRQKFHLRELLTLQKPYINNVTLLNKWKSILTSNTTLETRFYCEQCKKENVQKFQKTHMRSENDIVGTVKVSLQKF